MRELKHATMFGHYMLWLREQGIENTIEIDIDNSHVTAYVNSRTMIMFGYDRAIIHTMSNMTEERFFYNDYHTDDDSLFEDIRQSCLNR